MSTVGTSLAAEAGRLWASQPRQVAFVLAAVVAIGASVHVLTRPFPDPHLPVLGAIPAFAMRDQDGDVHESRSFCGRTSLVAFFYASCTTSCPRITDNMAAFHRRLQQHDPTLAATVHRVSITLDPENDSPDVLKRYAERLGVSSEQWSFLSGRSADLARVVADGFRVSFERVDPAAGLGSILHGEWIVLVDPTGMIRGYYKLGDIDQSNALMAAVASAAKEAGSCVIR